jgi:RNA polymerase sigma factor (sigma-70 family)
MATASHPSDEAAERLYRKAQADRWSVALSQFADALEASARKAFSGKAPDARDLQDYFDALHLADLGLACGCAAGNDRAWEHFVREHRPVLYRSADALDPSGGARELADSLYGELFGTTERDGKRLSLFRYFHGRSSLATWLRAILAQRAVDRARAGRRLESLPDDDAAPVVQSRPAPDPDRDRYAYLLERGLERAIARMSPRDRLRLGCYYAQEMTLAEVGRALGEHEATVSRQLAKSRRVLRDEIERDLRVEGRLNDAQIAECFETAVGNAGAMDLNAMLARNPEPDRSK